MSVTMEAECNSCCCYYNSYDPECWRVISDDASQPVFSRWKPNLATTPGKL